MRENSANESDFFSRFFLFLHVGKRFLVLFFVCMDEESKCCIYVVKGGKKKKNKGPQVKSKRQAREDMVEDEYDG